MTPHMTGVVPSLALGSASYSLEAQIVGSSVVFKESGDVMRRCRAQLRRLKVIDGLLPTPKPKLKPKRPTLLKVPTRQPTWSSASSPAKSALAQSAAKDDAEEEDAHKVHGAKSEAHTDEAKPDSARGGSKQKSSIRSAMREQKRNAMEHAAQYDPMSVDNDRSFADMRSSILTRTTVGHTGKTVHNRGGADLSPSTDAQQGFSAPPEPSVSPKKKGGSVLFEDSLSGIHSKPKGPTAEAILEAPPDDDTTNAIPSPTRNPSLVEMQKRRRSSMEEVQEVPGAYLDMMKGRVVEAPAFFDVPNEVDEVSQELSQALDIHISTVDNVRTIFADLAQGQEHLDEKQFKEATLKILNAQESEVPRYRLQGFYQEAMACAPVLESAAGQANKRVTVDKFVSWYRKNFYGGDIRDPGDRSAAEVFYQMKMSGHRGTIHGNLHRPLSQKR